MTGIILWLAIGTAFVLFLEWRISRMYPGGRDALEMKAHHHGLSQRQRAHLRVMMVVTWPYWAWGELRHYGKLLVILLRG